MSPAKKTIVALASILLTVLLGQSVTSAGAAIDSFETSIYETGSGETGRAVYVEISGVDPGMSTNLRVRRPGVDVPIYVLDIDDGSSRISTDELTPLRPGDSIEVRQPENAVDPIDTLVVPQGSLDIFGSAVSGTVRTAGTKWVRAYPTCLDQSERRLIPRLGRYSFGFGKNASPGRYYSLNVRAGRAFMEYVQRAPGERPCVDLDSASNPERVPGSVIPETWAIQLSGLDPTVNTTRLTVRRDGSPVLDRNMQTSGYGYLATNVKVRPGDRIELYRPQTETAPSTVIEVPEIRGTFDPAADLAAVTGGSRLRSAAFSACIRLACDQTHRHLIDVPASGGKVDFGQRQGVEPAVDLAAGDPVSVDVQFAALPLSYSFDAIAGDLVAPVQKIQAKNSYRIASFRRQLKRGLPVLIRSSEPASGYIVLSDGKVTFARESVMVRTGTTGVRLKFTAAGKRLIRRARPPQTLRVESRLTDRTGNSSQKFRTVRIRG
jgi:hypothetical protein